MNKIIIAIGFTFLSLTSFSQETLKKTKIKASHHGYYSDIIIDANPAQVWSVLTDFNSYSDWSYWIKNIKGDFKNQGECTVYLERNPAKNDKEITVNHKITLKENEFFSWSDKFALGMKDHHIFRVEATIDGKTRFIHTDESKGGLTWLLGNAIDNFRENHYPKYNQALKAEVEKRLAANQLKEENITNSKTQKPVIIIGGGVAGLSAAKRLKENNIPFIILEGSDHLGGRALTLDIAGNDSSWIEMGAGWIDDHETNSVYHMLNEVNTEVVPTVMRVRMYDQKTNQWKGSLGTISTLLKYQKRNKELLKISDEFSNLKEKIDAILPENPKRVDLFMLQSTQEMLNGGTLEEMHQNVFSPNYWAYLNYKETSSVMITGGYRKFIELLSSELSEDEVKLNHWVKSVTVLQDSSVVVKTSDGNVFEGSQVIVTVPLGVLKAGTIKFEPEFSKRKQGAIERVGFGDVEKVALTFQNAFWRKNPNKAGLLFSVPDPIESYGFVDVTETSGAGPGSPTSPSLACVFGAEKAKWAAENPEDAVKLVLSDLKKMFPKTYEEPIATAVSNWTTSPFSKGCYAFASVDTKLGDFRILAEPTHNGKVLFAGDAYAVDTYMGSVEGAFISGERAADVIIQKR